MRIGTSLSAAAASLALATVALGQSPPPMPATPAKPAPPTGIVVEDVRIKVKPGSLEEMLSEALKNNPDVRVAESKVREAEAELNRARMQLMQKVVSLRGAVEAQEGAVKFAEQAVKLAEAKVEQFTALHKRAAIDNATLNEARAALEETRHKLLTAKTRLAELQSEMEFLLGQNRMRFTFQIKPDHVVKWQLHQDLAVQQIREMELRIVQAVPGSTTDRLRKTLDKPMHAEFKSRPLGEVLQELQKQHGINFVVASKKVAEQSVTLQTEEMPLGAILEMLEDTLPGVHFAVRDYGILATSAESLPTGAIPLYTFWKAAKPAAASSEKKNEADSKR